jgi:hypothetical protein
VLAILTFLITLIVNVFAAISFFNASRWPSEAFAAVGRGPRWMWLTFLALAFNLLFWFGMFNPFGAVATVATFIYHLQVKPQLLQAVRSFENE